MRFFFNDTATTEIYTLSLHDALPISERITSSLDSVSPTRHQCTSCSKQCLPQSECSMNACSMRSEEHTPELQSRQYLVCRLLLVKERDRNSTRLTSRHASPSYNVFCL